MKTLTLALLLLVGIALLFGLGSTTVQPTGPPVYVDGAPPYLEPPQPPSPPRFTPEPVREAAEGLPVPIYPGTRVDQAEIAPPRVDAPRLPRITRRRHIQTTVASGNARFGNHTVVGQLRGTEPRALDDARKQLEREVAITLAPEVPASWKAPANLVNGLIVKSEIKPVVKDYGTLYEAHLDVDFNSPRMAQIRAAYQRERVAHRIVGMAGGLGFVLACLASLAGYIRADEATKGYYTNWLRVAAAAGVGASGVVIYQLLT